MNFKGQVSIEALLALLIVSLFVLSLLTVFSDNQIINTQKNTLQKEAFITSYCSLAIDKGTHDPKCGEQELKKWFISGGVE